MHVILLHALIAVCLCSDDDLKGGGVEFEGETEGSGGIHGMVSGFRLAYSPPNINWFDVVI